MEYCALPVRDTLKDPGVRPTAAMAVEISCERQNIRAMQIRGDIINPLTNRLLGAKFTARLPATAVQLLNNNLLGVAVGFVIQF